MKKLRKIIAPMFVLLSAFMVHTILAQDQQQTKDLEKKQKEIQTLYIDSYRIIDQYPDAHYNYVYDDGKVTEVEIVGITDAQEKQMLGLNLIKLENLKNELVNLKDAAGIYYISETEAEPKEGYRELYQELQKNLDYPPKAEEFGAEGTVFVKFVVDAEGNVKNVHSTNNIDTPHKYVEEQLIDEAKKAIIATSGSWQPGKVGDIPVDQWVYLPVKFNLENPGYTGFIN